MLPITINYLMAVLVWVVFFTWVYIKWKSLFMKLPNLKECFKFDMTIIHYLLLAVFVVMFIWNIVRGKGVDYFILLIITSCIAPIAEEIVFRGFFIGFFEQFLNKYKTWVLVVGVNLGFSLIHNLYAPVMKTLVELLLTFLLGVVVSVVYLRTKKNIGYAILIHAVYNVVVLFSWRFWL